MNARRSFLKSISSALAVPFFARNGAGQVPALPAPGDPEYWDKIRDQFLLARDKVFFNTGTLGAMPKAVFDRTVEHMRKVATDIADWDYRGENWISGYSPDLSIRTKAARLVGADVKEIALTGNATEGMNFVAGGLDLEPGSEIVTSDQEHPGGICPWLLKQKRSKVVVKTVALPKPAHSPDEILELIRKATTPRTRVIEMQHVITGSGAILPVKEICAEARSKGIVTVIDGAQALGHIAVNVKDIGCDAYIGNFHKWLLAPAGTGFLYINKDRIGQVWTTLASSQWDNHDDDGYRLSQRGTGNLSLWVGAEAALDFHFAIGPERVQQRIKFLGDYLRDGLRKIPKTRIYSPEDPAMCAGITVYNVEGYTGPKLQDEMWNRGRLRPRASGDVFGVRHSTHIYNSTAEIDRALHIVKQLAG
jgi:isopenicillin-N epimerase